MLPDFFEVMFYTYLKNERSSESIKGSCKKDINLSMFSPTLICQGIGKQNNLTISNENSSFLLFTSHC